MPGGDPKSLAWAYALWVLGLGGLLGLHRFYLGQRRMGLVELFTLGGLGLLAARDLLTMNRLVDRANGVQGTVQPTAWARRGWKGRWLPIMWRGRLVGLAVALSIGLVIAAQSWTLLVSVAITWALGVWTFAVGVTVGGQVLRLLAPVLVTWHYRLSGRAAGEPLAGIEDYPREAIRVDPVPDEAFLPLATALAVAFQLVEWGPAFPIFDRVYELGLPLVPIAAGLLLPIVRVPVGMALRSVRYNERGELSSKRPIGQQLSTYFGLAFVLGALLQAYIAREAGVFTLVFSLTFPILLAQAWYQEDRLARDVHRIENAVRARIDVPMEAPDRP